MLYSFLLNNSNKKMLAPHAVDIHNWNLSNYYSTMFHICRTILQHFSLLQVKLCIGQQKYKQKFMTQGVKDRPTKRPTNRPNEWIRAHSLNSYFAFLQNSRKNGVNDVMLSKIPHGKSNQRLWECVWLRHFNIYTLDNFTSWLSTSVCY